MRDEGFWGRSEAERELPERRAETAQLRKWVNEATERIFEDANKQVTATMPIRDGLIVFGEDFNYTLRYLKRSRLARLRRFLKL